MGSNRGSDRGFSYGAMGKERGSGLQTGALLPNVMLFYKRIRVTCAYDPTLSTPHRHSVESCCLGGSDVVLEWPPSPCEMIWARKEKDWASQDLKLHPRLLGIGTEARLLVEISSQVRI